MNPSNSIIGVTLACLTAISLIITAPDIGLTWDEPVYLTGAKSYISFFNLLVKDPHQAMKPETIDHYWDLNHEHPPLDKVWSGVVWSCARYVFDDLTAHRLGNILLTAFLVLLLYLLVAESYGRMAGLFASIALMSMPRFFFHAHLASLDVPVAAGIFTVIFVFWQSRDRDEWWWGIVIGIVFGLAEAIKLNATFLPIALVIWSMIFRPKRSILLRQVLMATTAIPTFILSWPWLYFQTLHRIKAYAGFHAHHFKIGQWYLGNFCQPPPWHFVFVMTWAVVPLTVMLAAFAGMARVRKGLKDNGLGWLLIICALVSIAPFAIGKSLLYDNDRLFMPLFPFIAALSGAGFGWILNGLRDRAFFSKNPVPAGAMGFILLFAAFSPQFVAVAGLYPHLLSYYSEGLGGLPGANGLGFETTYWCESYAKALPYINWNAKPGDRIWVEPSSFDILTYYQIIGRLRPDLKILSDANAPSAFGSSVSHLLVGSYRVADWWIFHYRQSQYGSLGANYSVRLFLNTKTPVYSVRYRGVPIMDLYQRSDTYFDFLGAQASMIKTATDGRLSEGKVALPGKHIADSELFLSAVGHNASK
jgi:4-amino-4-deoxy-L-arabinose transferase-like glycosyltransferase